jgi:hypothetical protein
MKKIKVRFNLGRGVNYMKYKVEYPDKSVVYIHPAEGQLVMSDCKLKSNKKTADRIFNGETKSVCGWVLCSSIEIKKDDFLKNEGYSKIRYNPKVDPNWVFEDANADDKEFKTIINIDYSLYCMDK